jgi:hypothetical protein
MHPQAVVMAAGILHLVGCGGFVGEAFINRRATLTAHVLTADGRVGVPCQVTALLFGDEYAQAEMNAGNDAEVAVGMLTPAKATQPVTARVALRVDCQGYAVVTTPERETAVAAVGVPVVEFGTVTVPVK